MIIAGVDFSKNSPGVVSFILDDNLNIEDVDYLGFTTVKKTAALDKNLVYYHKDAFNNDIAKAIFLRDVIKGYILDNYIIDYVAFEGYAFNAKGKVFDIAESTMCTKLFFYENEVSIRIYDPNSIKKFATGKGNAKKEQMDKVFDKDTFDHLPAGKSPRVDLVDAYFVAELLRMELKLRLGLINLKDLPKEKIEIFNRVTRAYPENILVRPFIEGAKNEEDNS